MIVIDTYGVGENIARHYIVLLVADLDIYQSKRRVDCIELEVHAKEDEQRRGEIGPLIIRVRRDEASESLDQPADGAHDEVGTEAAQLFVGPFVLEKVNVGVVETIAYGYLLVRLANAVGTGTQIVVSWSITDMTFNIGIRIHFPETRSITN